MKKINFKQPKYMLPAILYLPLLGLGWLIIDIFHTEIKEKPSGLQTTEYLNSNLPSANVKEIGSKRENMMKSFGKIRDESAVKSAGRDEESTEEYETKYSDEEVAELERQMAEAKAEQDRLAAEKASRAEDEARKAKEREELRKAARDAASGSMSDIPSEEERIARSKARQQEMYDELERELGNIHGNSAKDVIAEYRRRYGKDSLPGVDDEEKKDTVPAKPQKKRGGFYGTDTEAVSALDDDAEDNAVVKKRKGSSTQFNTINENDRESKMLRAIIDEEIKVVDGSRVRLRLLDDAVVNGITLKKGTYLYALMSGFSKQRVQGKVESVMAGDELVKINLSVYDLDGMEGLYVPGSSFRETSKEVVGGAFQQSMGGISNTISTGDMLTNFAGQAVQNAYQKTSNAIAKAIKKNKVTLKYGTQIYLLNGKQLKQRSNRQTQEQAQPRQQQKQGGGSTPSLDRFRRGYGQ